MTPAPPGAILHRIPRAVVIREGLLAVLPALLTVGLLLLATQPAYQTLLRSRTSWTPYAYQGLTQDVQTYQAARLDPALSAGERRDIRDRALSSAQSPAQFTALGTVEGYGDARLARVARLLREDTPGSVAAAAREAVRLNAQAGSYADETRVASLRALGELRRALIVTAGVTGLLSMLLIGRALLLWRAERDRRARREARQREALSLASHELRRPLQSLLLASDLLRQADTPGERQRLLGVIEDSAAQIASRADLTRLNDLYLDVTLRVVRADLRPPLARFAGERVSVHLPDEPVVWTADPGRVRQIVENLVENALKYTDGPVEVGLGLRGGQPEITVRDHGPGLSPDLRERVFLPYERGPRGLSGGHGLGLSLVRRYARAHGGDVTLDDAEGGGTLARVMLGEPPLVDEGLRV